MKKNKFLMCSILVFLAILSPVCVSALSFSTTSVGYGYTQTYNGTTSNRTFATFASSNLTKYNYELPNSSDIDIDEFDFRFTISGNFQKDTNYIVTFNWYSYNSQDDVFYNYFSHFASDAKCRVTNWNSTNESESACFTNWNVSGQNVNNQYVKVTFTFTPKKTFYGLTLYFTMPAPYYSYPTDGWEILDLEYRIVTSDSQDIINNQNQNTQNIINSQNNNTSSIINNQNQNTQSIIDNQNANSQAQIESQKVCQEKILYYSDTITPGSLQFNGTITSSNTNWGVTDYIEVSNAISLSFNDYFTANVTYCFYSSDKSLISCSAYVSGNPTPIIPTNSRYARFSIRSSNQPKVILNICKNGNQGVSDSINDLNDTMNNSDVSGASSDASNFFSSFTESDHGGLSAIVTAPLVVVNSMLTNNSCQDLRFQVMGTDVSFPSGCILWNLADSTIVTLWQTIVCGFVSYLLLKKLFKDIENLKNPSNSEVSTLDL